MTVAVLGKSTMIWLVVLVLAIVNGALREGVLVPALGVVPGLMLSGVILAVLIVATAFIALPWIGRQAPTRYIAVGLLWFGLTLVFEFTFGRLVQGKSWSELSAAYQFRDGNLWPLVLLVAATAPYLAARLRRWV